MGTRAQEAQRIRDRLATYGKSMPESDIARMAHWLSTGELKMIQVDPMLRKGYLFAVPPGLSEPLSNPPNLPPPGPTGGVSPVPGQPGVISGPAVTQPPIGTVRDQMEYLGGTTWVGQGATPWVRAKAEAAMRPGTQPPQWTGDQSRLLASMATKTTSTDPEILRFWAEFDVWRNRTGQFEWYPALEKALGSLPPGPFPSAGGAAGGASTGGGIAGIIGLDWIDDFVDEQIAAGRSPAEARALLYETPEFNNRFSWYKTLAAKGRAISPAEGIQLEQTFASILRAAGLPPGYYDQPDDFAKWIAGEVSPSEIGDRVRLATEEYYQTDPSERAELERIYGMNEGNYVAFALDETRALPLLESQLAAGRIAGAARRTGFGLLTGNEAETLAASGVSREQAAQGFGALAQASPLFSGLTGTNETDIDRTTQLEAGFGGLQSAADRIERQRRRRQAAFEGSGGFAGNAEGFAGLGSAR